MGEKETKKEREGNGHNRLAEGFFFLNKERKKKKKEKKIACLVGIKRRDWKGIWKGI